MATNAEVHYLGQAGTERIVAKVKSLETNISGLGSVGHLIRNVAVPANNWVDNTQTVTVDGVLEDPMRCTVMIGPDWSSADVCEEYEINCVGQGNNTLTFQCVYVPSEDVIMNATILI